MTQSRIINPLEEIAELRHRIIQLEQQNATRQNGQQEIHRQEHQDRNQGWEAAEASNCNCAVDSTKQQGQSEEQSLGEEQKVRRVIYIAGPMDGYPDHNFPAFHMSASHFRTIGHSVLNPAELNHVGDGRTKLEIVQRDATALLLCNTIFMLRGWQHSTGAMAEHHLAKWAGLTIWHEAD